MNVGSAYTAMFVTFLREITEQPPVMVKLDVIDALEDDGESTWVHTSSGDCYVVDGTTADVLALMEECFAEAVSEMVP